MHKIYTGSSHKPRVVQSPCTSKGFHYNHTRLQLLKHTARDFLCSSITIQETSNAQAHKQETSKTNYKETQFELLINNIRVLEQNNTTLKTRLILEFL